MGKSTISMVIFNNYVKLPEGIYIYMYFLCDIGIMCSILQLAWLCFHWKSFQQIQIMRCFFHKKNSQSDRQVLARFLYQQILKSLELGGDGRTSRDFFRYSYTIWLFNIAMENHHF